MSEINVQLCPETGICSIIRGDGTKVDLMPDEVSEIRDASDNPDAIRQVLSAIDSIFAENLTSEELKQVSKTLK